MKSLATIVVAVLMLGLVTPASAGSKTFEDEQWDVSYGSRLAPVDPLDISFVKVDYDSDRLKVVVRFVSATDAASRWTTAKIDLETTGDNAWDYLLMARYDDDSVAGAPPKGDIVKTFQPAGKAAVTSIDDGKPDRSTFTFRQGWDWPGALTFEVPTTAIGKPKQVRIHAYVDLSDDRYASGLFASDDFPDGTSGKAQWSKPMSMSKAAPSAAVTGTLATKTVTKGKSVTLAIGTGKTAGKAAVFDGKKKLGSVKVKKSGKATYTLPKSLKVGKHKIKVKFTPKGGKAGKKISAGILTVTKK